MSTLDPTPSSSIPTAPKAPPRRRKVRYAKVFGYLLDPYLLYHQALKDGTAIKGQMFATFAAYQFRLAKHCGVKFEDMIRVRNPDPEMSPIYCLVTASNLSTRSKIPRADIIAKAKEFFNTEEEPKWYYVVRD